MALPLRGIRVLDLGRLFAPAWATQLLGDLGADIIKIERPKIGDIFRHYGPPFLADKDGKQTLESSYYISVNRNKRAITLDISTPEGQQITRDLAKTCHVLVENFKVGDLKRYGLDHDSIKAINPDIIYCSITGFGQTGPYRKRPGTDSLFQAMSGLMSVTGEPDGEPNKVGLVIEDLVSGMYAAVGILAALREKEVLGGKGQMIDIALLDTAMATMSHRAQDYLISGEVPQAMGSKTVGSVPAQIFQCSDGKINLQAGGDEDFKRLCAVIKRPELFEDERFSSRRKRVANAHVLIPMLEEIFAKRSMNEWFEDMLAAGMMVGPIFNVKQAFENEQVIHRRNAVEVPHPVSGTLKMVANPIRFSETTLDRYEAPPTLGQHTAEVLKDVLGYDDAKIAALKAAKTI